MIKFFRKIRQKMLSENKFSKYLIYAVGEIVLVVIGILIALNINNWNEERKENRIEIELLYSFKNGLEKDLADLEYNVKSHARGMVAADTIINALENEVPYNIQNISRNFSDLMTPTFFVYSTSAFETLKSKGITIISNKELRDDIIGVYDAQYNFFLKYQEYYVKDIERGYAEIFPTRFEQAYSYDLTNINFPGSIRPLNFETLKNDQELLYYIKSLQNRTVILVDLQYAQLRESIINVKDKINQEINYLEDN